MTDIDRRPQWGLSSVCGEASTLFIEFKPDLAVLVSPLAQPKRHCFLLCCQPSNPAGSWAMPALTRRHDPEGPLEVWHVYYGDVRVGTIGIRAGSPS
jgi:hypothetical protein